MKTAENQITKPASRIQDLSKTYSEIRTDITVLKQIFIPTEVECLKIMVIKRRPLSTRQIYGTILKAIFINTINKYQWLKGKLAAYALKHDKQLYYSTLFQVDKKNLEKKISKYDPYNFDVNNVNDDIMKMKMWLYDKSAPFFDSVQLFDSETQLIRRLEKLLRGVKIRFPSYQKVLVSLETLESWKILAKRYSQKKSKADFYWILHPNFSSNIGNEIEQIKQIDSGL